MDKLRKEMFSRINLLIDMKLNSRILFDGIHEYSLSMMEYPAGIIDIKHGFTDSLDKDVRKVLSEKNLFIQSAAIERLYIARKLGGRGLLNISNKVECTLKITWDVSNRSTVRNTPRSLRRELIQCCEKF